MTIYCKIINGKLIPASKNLDITGIAEIPNIALANGYLPYNAIDYALYEQGLKELLEDGSLRDITQDASYIEKQKQDKKTAINLEYVDKFNAFDIMWSRNVALGKKTAAQYNTARVALATELATKLAEV